VTATFHGRDIFMPVAAHLAAGAATLAEAGDQIAADSLVALPRPASRVGDGMAECEVVTTDRFGNVQLSVTGADAARAGIVPGIPVIVAWQGRERTVPFRTTFGEVAPGDLVSYTDSSGFVAIAVNGGSAARSLALHPGTRVTLSAPKLFISLSVPFPAGA
jgi:S-adenosyl-L-methionine hydrolase (adenosine-forming)